MSEKETKPKDQIKSDVKKTKSASVKHTKTKAGAKAKKEKKGINWILITGLAVILIPCLILLYIIIGTKENAGVPVVGDRFEQELDPRITEEDMNWLKQNLVFENVDSVNINLISATLRITINANDDADEARINQLVEDAYNKVSEHLPIDKYFTNRNDGDKVIKMYDIEVQCYNLIPEEGSDQQNIYIVKSKSGASEGPVTDVLSSAKNADVANGLLHPETTPNQDGDNAAAGEN